MTSLRGISQLSDCLLTHMLLAYWRKLLADYVVADIEQDLVWVEIRVKKKTVEKGAGNTLMWKPGIR